MQKSRYVAVIGVLSVLVLALALNPSAEQHRTQIKAAIAERSPIAGALGIGSLTAFTSTYHSLGVASYTTANDKTVSVGAFGVVVVTP
jgi:hypothetical protein